MQNGDEQIEQLFEKLNDSELTEYRENHFKRLINNDSQVYDVAQLTALTGCFTKEIRPALLKQEAIQKTQKLTRQLLKRFAQSDDRSQSWLTMMLSLCLSLLYYCFTHPIGSLATQAWDFSPFCS